MKLDLIEHLSDGAYVVGGGAPLVPGLAVNPASSPENTLSAGMARLARLQAVLKPYQFLSPNEFPDADPETITNLLSALSEMADETMQILAAVKLTRSQTQAGGDA